MTDKEGVVEKYQVRTFHTKAITTFKGPEEGSAEKEMATHSSILAWRIPMDRGAWQATVHGVTKSWTQLSD